MGSVDEFPPLIFTDDGWIMATQPPVTAQDLRDKIVGGYVGTGGALGWSIGDHEVYQCELTSGEQFGAADCLDGSKPSFVHSATPGAEERIASNLQAMIASDRGPLTVLAAESRARGIPFFPRVRMNSHYVIDSDHPGYGSFRRDRPDLLIGRPGEALPEGSLQWAIRTGKDFAFAEVRQYMEEVICETFEGFDVDGVELDFMRHPGWFRIEEAQANAYLMTDLLQRVRRRLRETQQRRQRRQWLIVRVPPTLADSLRTGLDVADWIEQDLVDIVVVGGGFIPYETPVHEFVDAARDTACRIYGCIEATRYTDERHLRGLATRWYGDGADGIYLYNFYTMAPPWNRRVAAELSDPARLRGLDKVFGTDRAGPVSPVEGHSGAFRYASPSTQLPVEVAADFDGAGPHIRVRVDDNVDSAQDALRGTLSIQLPQLGDGDRLAVTLNGISMDWTQARVHVGGWTRQQLPPLFWAHYPVYPQAGEQEATLVEFDVAAPPLRSGDNDVVVHLHSARTGASVVVDRVEITVTYA